jgi:hypothetical protein
MPPLAEQNRSSTKKPIRPSPAPARPCRPPG